MTRLLFAPFVLLIACGTSPADDTQPGDETAAVDADSDGFTAAEDCDDDDAAVNPDAAELCNGVDDDCDGSPDVGATDALQGYTDADGDGYGDPATATATCDLGGLVDNGDDCDDTSAAISPDAVELCNEVDDDCDGATDEDAADATTWHPDTDGDGYGDAATSVTQCAPPEEISTPDGSDCDDADATVMPGAEEHCDGLDNDCDPATADAGVWIEQGGIWTDWTATLAAGTVDGPVSGGITTGTLHVCDGTWYLQLSITGDAEVVGHTASSPATVSAGSYGTTFYARGTAGSINVSIRDLTILGGTGAYSSSAGFSGGGGVLCDGMGSDTLALDGVTITGGQTYTGGAVLAVDCDVSLTNSTLSGNQSDYGGGFLGYSTWSDASLTMTDSVIEGNVAGTGGGIYVQAPSASTLTMTNSLVRDNSAEYGGGGLATFYAVGSTCNADAGTYSGVVGNSSPDGAVLLYDYSYGGSFTSAGCNFGATETTDDNLPNDIYVGDLATGYAYGDDATFTCDGAGCR